MSHASLRQKPKFSSWPTKPSRIGPGQPHSPRTGLCHHPSGTSRPLCLCTAPSGTFSPTCHAPSHFIGLSVYISQSGTSPRVTAPKKPNLPRLRCHLPAWLSFSSRCPFSAGLLSVSALHLLPLERDPAREGRDLSVQVTAYPEPRTVPAPQDILSNACQCTPGDPSEWCL